MRRSRLPGGCPKRPPTIGRSCNAFSVVLGINASDAEIAESEKALEAWRNLPGGSADDARANLVWTLINHNDFVTLR